MNYTAMCVAPCPLVAALAEQDMRATRAYLSVISW